MVHFLRLDLGLLRSVVWKDGSTSLLSWIDALRWENLTVSAPIPSFPKVVDDVFRPLPCHYDVYMFFVFVFVFVFCKY